MTKVYRASIAIVVPTHNRRVLAEPVFDALARETRADGNAWVVVVDQGSQDGVDTLARQMGFSVVHSNAATAGGLRNVGASTTNADWLVFIDSDVLVPAGYMTRLREAMATYPDDIIGCNYSLPQNPSWTEKNWFCLTYQVGSGERQWLNAGNLSIAHRRFREVGGFNESLTSGEDTELCGRFLAMGGRVLQLESLQAAHLGNPKTLPAFVAKQIWHGQGAPLSNANTIASIAHAVAVLVGISVLYTAKSNWLQASGLVLTNSIPLLAFALLCRKRKKLLPLLPSLANLHAYFLGRFVAFIYRSQKQR